MKRINLLFYLLIALSITKGAKAQTAAKQQAAVLNHIAVYVSDLGKSSAFYESMLMLKKIEEPFKDGRHVWFTLGPAGQLHLIQGAKSGVLHDKNEHLCFSVPSISEFTDRLNAQKIDYVNWEGTAKAPTIRVDGVKQVYFQDPDGHWIEVNDQH